MLLRIKSGFSPQKLVSHLKLHVNNTSQIKGAQSVNVERRRHVTSQLFVAPPLPDVHV